MGSKVEVWKLAEPVTPCVSVRKYCSAKLEKGVDIHKLQEEIASVGARVHSIDEQIDNIKAALPKLDNKIGYASLGMPTSSFPLDELQNLKTIHFKLLQFWGDLSRKQLKKLAHLSDCLQILEEQRESKDTLTDGIDTYKEIEQHISEKQLDIRKNHELQLKLHLDRIHCIPKPSKPTPTYHSPPKRGPQQIGKEQKGKEDVSAPSTSGLQWISIPSTLDLYRISAPPYQRTPAPPPDDQQIQTLSSPAHQWNAGLHRCKESTTTPATPVLQSPSVCNTIKV